MCEKMEMPTPCQKCGEIFDLLDGYDSEKWYPNTTICASCFKKEEKEIEVDEEISELKESLADAEYTIKDCTKRLIELGELSAPSSSTGVPQDSFIKKHLDNIKNKSTYAKIINLLNKQQELCLDNIMKSEFYQKHKLDFPKAEIFPIKYPDELKEWESTGVQVEEKVK